MAEHQFDPVACSKALIAIRGRAERLDGDQIVDSFSSVGPLADLISSQDHQVVFGRRGTGKTHALRFLYAQVHEDGDIGIYVDMLNLGSDTSIYNDQSLGVSERATRLLIDTLSHIEEGFLDYATSGVDIEFDKFSTVLDNLNSAISKVRVHGETTVTDEQSHSDTASSDASASASASPSGILGNLGFGKKKTKEEVQRSTSVTKGRPVYSARFPQLGVAVRDLVQFFPNPRVWIIFDEWSSIPMELQPFLADLLKRSFFNLQKITVKIGAVEHRTRLILEQAEGEKLGLDPTADIRTDIRLDDFLLFDNDAGASVAYFKDFLFKHVRSVCKEKGLPEPASPDQLVSRGFSQRNSFEEFVKAVEGVPRDAIHIASNCAQKAFARTIDVPTVRQAAHRYYQEDKSSQVEDNQILRELLKFIVDNAIRKKRTNSFLLEFGVRDRNVDLLFDRRLVHIRRRNVSSRDNPGARYYHYKIDYGCYVDLAATQQMPEEHDFSAQNIVGRHRRGRKRSNGRRCEIVSKINIGFGGFLRRLSRFSAAVRLAREVNPPNALFLFARGRSPRSPTVFPEGDLRYEAEARRLQAGEGFVDALPPEARAYEISGRNVIDQRFRCRRQPHQSRRPHRRWTQSAPNAARQLHKTSSSRLHWSPTVTRPGDDRQGEFAFCER